MAICQLNHIAELFWTDLLSIFHASKLNKIGLIVLASVDHTHTACMLIVYGLDMYTILTTHNKLLLRYNTFPKSSPFCWCICSCTTTYHAYYNTFQHTIHKVLLMWEFMMINSQIGKREYKWEMSRGCICICFAYIYRREPAHWYNTEAKD